MSGRYVHTIWCDDIRQEIGNKPSFMGVYSNGIVFSSLPTMLQQLAIYTWIISPLDNPFKKLSLKVVRDDGAVLVEIPSEELNIKEAAKKALAPQDDATKQIIMTGITIRNVEIPVGCRYFTVLVETESEVLEGTKLRICSSSQLGSQLKDAAE